ncbi:MAG: sulfur carrier protein ThiS [Candidatus Omnitrophota bacterium]
MLIKINGKAEEIKTGLSLVGLISFKGLCAEKLVIEHNLRIIPKEEWQGVVLQENDSVEILSFVGGG